jgi:hypothetical protein
MKLIRLEQNNLLAKFSQMLDKNKMLKQFTCMNFRKSETVYIKLKMQ